MSSQNSNVINDELVETVDDLGVTAYDYYRRHSRSSLAVYQPTTDNNNANSTKNDVMFGLKSNKPYEPVE